ncbi:MAG TPA: hypothetical protein VKZ75_05300, partial [Cyclobacteriaceae bacterium]|nr:hypothetical protein [Cyclobacteriaceae bacterium]
MGKRTKSKTASKSEGHFSLLTDFDIHLFRSGKHFKLHEKLGSHLVTVDGKNGAYFAVWAPNAKRVSVIGNFNYWDANAHNLSPRWDESGIWEGFFPDVKKGEAYKYAIHSNTGELLEKADPFARYCEPPPLTASIVWQSDYKWQDKKWLSKRKDVPAGTSKPYSVYEVHIGSWKKILHDNNRSLNFAELAR